MDQSASISTRTSEGMTLLEDHVHNHGTAYTLDERRRLGLEGLLPHAVETLQRQSERVLLQQVDDDARASGKLFPSQTDILETEITTAVRSRT